MTTTTNRAEDCKECNGSPKQIKKCSIQNFNCLVCVDCLEVVEYEKESKTEVKKKKDKALKQTDLFK